MSTTLIRGTRQFGAATLQSVGIDGATIVWVGPTDQDQGYSGADAVIEAQGALLTPAFVDAHVHTVQTGAALDQLDLTGLTGAADLLDRLAAHLLHAADGPVVAWGWDETTWVDPTLPTAQELATVCGDRDTYLGRIDGHSALVSPRLAALAAGADGAGEVRVERTAHHLVRDELARAETTTSRRRAAERACAHFAGQGIVGFHENAAPHIGPVEELAIVRGAAQSLGLRPTLYWGARHALSAAAQHQVAGLAGDLNADGALGSRTASLSDSYADDAGHCGFSYLSADEIAEHVVACTEAGLQAGFHCIGDAAISEIGWGLTQAAHEVGRKQMVAAGHRLEHLEMPSEAVIALLAKYGVIASVQPQFDALWGGPDQMYAARVGPRWRSMNPFAALHEAGVVLAFGSDSPVTPVAVWDTLRAAVQHHNPQHRLTFETALAAHTRGGWLAGRDNASGMISPGYRADLALWQVDDPTPIADFGCPEANPALLRTISAGQTIWHEGDVRKVEA